MRRTPGTLIKVTTQGIDEPYEAFLPSPLPPRPPLELKSSDHDLIEKANRALGRLDGMTALLPDVSLFLYAYVRKEAVVSSQIEGTVGTLVDLMLFENMQSPGAPIDDVRAVSAYVSAIDHGVRRLRAGQALSVKLIREVNGILLARSRGFDLHPGELRQSQVWLGGSRPARAVFVPPPADRVPECMTALEKFLHGEPVPVPTLVKAGLAHAQFETIHPFLDGNGRSGRLLITLILVADRALSSPILYLSLWFKLHRREYYDRLQRVRSHGDWEGWLRFFLRGVVEMADETVDTTRRVLALFDKHRREIETLGRAAASAFRVHELLQRRPITGVREMASSLGLTYPTVSAAVERMRDRGIVRELTGHKRNRVFAYAPYVDLLSEGTEPLTN